MVQKTFHGILTGVIMIGLFVMVVLILGKMTGSCEARIVLSGSMEPGIPTGSVAFVDRHYPFQKVELGEVIAYQVNERIMVLHRVIGKDEETLETKGDANEHSDGWCVTPENYYGKIRFSIPKMGFWLSKMQTTAGKIQVLLWTIMVVILSCFVEGKSHTEKKKKEKKCETKEMEA